MALQVWEILKEAIMAYTGLSPATFFMIAAVGFAFYYLLSSLFVSLNRNQRPRAVEELVELLPPPVQLGEVTEEELRVYDGSDPKKPLLMAIKGEIYDVSQSRYIKVGTIKKAVTVSDGTAIKKPVEVTEATGCNGATPGEDAEHTEDVKPVEDATHTGDVKSNEDAKCTDDVKLVENSKHTYNPTDEDTKSTEEYEPSESPTIETAKTSEMPSGSDEEKL